MSNILSNIHSDVNFCLRQFEKQITNKQIAHFFIKSDRKLFDIDGLKQYLTEADIKNTALLKDIFNKSIRVIELNNTELYELTLDENKAALEYITINDGEIKKTINSKYAIDLFTEDGSYNAWLNQDFAHKCNEIQYLIELSYPQVNINPKIEQPETEGKLQARVISLFCSIVNQSGIMVRRGEESAENYCKRVCDEFRVDYAANARKTYADGADIKASDKNLKKIRELILPKLPAEIRQKIEDYINSKAKIFG